VIEPRLPHKPKRSSDAAFGRVFGLIFVAYGAWPLVHMDHPHYAFVAIGLLLLLASQFSPDVLAPFNSAWLKLGDVLHSIVAPVVMGLVFFLTVVPTGIIIKLLGKDLLRLKRNQVESTYWIVRDPAGPSPDSMKRQF